MNLELFGKIAPYLENPLVLVGFVLFLFFGIHRVLIKSQIIPPLSKIHAHKVVLAILKYGFIASIIVVILGFAYGIVKSTMNDLSEIAVIFGKLIGSRKSELRVVDTYQELDVLHVKLQNSGDGSAFIYELRLLFYEGYGVKSLCFPVFISVVDFPFSVEMRENLINLGNPNLKNSVPPDLKKIPENLKQPAYEFSSIPTKRDTPVFLSEPLKLAEEILPGGNGWIQLKIQPDLSHRNGRKFCGYTEVYEGHAILYYDRDKKLISSIFQVKW